MIKKFESDIKANLKKAISLLLMTTVGTVSVVSAGNLSRKVNVDVDGEKLSTLTLNEDTDKILSQVGVKAGPHDIVMREDENNEININVKKSFDVHVKRGEDVFTVKMAAGTVKDALEKSGIELGCSEGTNFSPDDELTILAECISNQDDSSNTTSLALTQGEYRIKIVAGEDTKFDISLSISDGSFHELGL